MQQTTGKKNTLRAHKLTLFAVLGIICAGFILLGNIFLIVVRDAQVRLIEVSVEQVSEFIGGAAQYMIDDVDMLQSFITTTVVDVAGLIHLDIVVKQEGKDVRIASLHKDAPYEEVITKNTVQVAQAVAGQVVMMVRDDGHIESVYAFTNSDGNPLGYVALLFRQDVFAPSVDRNVVRTMIILLAVLGVTMLLLLWFIGIGEHRRLLRKTKETQVVYEELLEKTIHEVQTPLTVIAGYATMLAGAELDTAGKKHVAQIKQAVQQLQRFIAHATYATQLEQKTIVPNIVSVNPVTVVHGVIESMQKKYNHLHPHITCTAKSSDTMLVDQRQFSFVLEQVLHNAVFHGGGSVSVHIETESGEVLVRVVDEGSGTKKVEHKKLVQKWYKGGNDGTQLRGSGLGMWIVEKLLIPMRGSLSVEKNETGGTTVTIRVPLSV